MAVIDAQRARGPLLADGADAALALQHEVVIARRHAVDALELRVATLFRTIGALPRLPPGMVRPAEPPLNVDLAPVGRVVPALVGTRARAIVGALRTLPLRCQALA
jgi:hypothetical protein